LPESQRKRFTEEWQCHVDEIPGEVGKLIVAFGFLRASSKMSRGLTDATPNMSGQNLNRPSCALFARWATEFLMSALGNNSKTSLKHFIVELNNNVFTRGDEAEILPLRHQLTVLRRKSPKRLALAISTVWFLLASIGLRPACVEEISHRSNSRIFRRIRCDPL
jgi:hypothetical protein